MITSTSNPKIRWLRELQKEARLRRENKVCVVEGVRLAEEALQAGWGVQMAIHTGDLNQRSQALVQTLAAQGVVAEVVSPHVMRAASDTQAPQGILLVLSVPPSSLPDRLDFALIADGVSDPGNLGAMLRTAAAAGVQAVFLAPGTADPYAPKVLRAGMGAHFHLPILSLNWEEIEKMIARSALEIYLAEVDAGQIYTKVDFRSPVALIVGSEAAGPSQEARALARQRVYIPMPGHAESLNAAVAAAILLFEVVRQREKAE